jgi:enoyl-CoA hydratase/carnithine racemase
VADVTSDATSPERPSSANVRVTRRRSMAIVTLTNPERRNPLDRATATDLLAAFTTQFADSTVRSLAITGEGEAFCAGGDLRQMGEFHRQSGPAAYEWPAPIVQLQQLVLHAPIPVMAAVNGASLAGGLGLAGMCDIVLAVRSATFGTPEVKVGLFPMIIVAQLCRSFPRKSLLEMMLTGLPIDAGEAHRLGFVNHLYDSVEDMNVALDQYARQFETVGPAAVRLGRRAFTLLADLPAAQALDAAQFLNVPFFLGDELREGAEAFLQRRRPGWATGSDQ